MQLDALMGNDISFISHFTFSQYAPELSFQQNLFTEANANAEKQKLLIVLLTAPLTALCSTIIAVSLIIPF